MAMRQKRTAVAGRVPTTSDLLLGQLAVNTRDGRLFMRTNDGVTDKIITVGNETSPLLGTALKEMTGAAFMAALGVTSGGFVLHEARTPVGTSVEFISLGGYRDLMVVGVGLTHGGTLAAIRQMQVGNSGGYVSGAASYPHPTGASSVIPVSTSTLSARSFALTITNFNRTEAFKPISFGGSELATNAVPVGIVSAAALDRVRFTVSNGAAFTGGTIYIFGRA